MGTFADPPDGIQRTRVTIAEAREIILDSLSPLGSEGVGIELARGRVLAEALRSDRLIPPRATSGMDGFAVRAQDLGRLPATLRVVEELPAGRATHRKLGPGEAARIMTGSFDAMTPATSRAPAISSTVGTTCSAVIYITYKCKFVLFVFFAS